MTHRDGLPSFSDGVAHASRCPASPQRTLLAENIGKPPLRSRMRPVGGHRKSFDDAPHRLQLSSYPTSRLRDLYEP